MFIGCASVTFEQNMNQKVGKKFKEVIRVPESWYHREKIDERTYEMQSFDSNNNCSVAYIIRSNDDVVVGWRFIDNINPSDCDIFRTGA